MKRIANMLNFLKHFSLLFIAGLICYIFLDFDDYCSGIETLFIVPFLLIILILNILTLFIFNYFRNKRNKTNRNKISTFYVLGTLLIMALFFCGQNLYQLSYKPIWMGTSQEDDFVNLILFDDNHFELKKRSNHYACIKRGKFEQKGNYIYLKRKDLIRNYDIKLDSIYYLNKDKSELIPQNRNTKILPFVVIK